MGAVWEDPPPAALNRRPRHSWADLATLARSRPGEWLRLEPYGTRSTADCTASRVRHGKVLTLGPGPWEATSQGTVVWIRFVGEAG